ncbi:MAG: hypothetical protein RLZZ350_138 [Verrucomicrobiota bacterium]|jgi:hypothetical protein
MKFLPALALTVCAATLHAAVPLAFPSAEGFGALASGGRGGQIFVVTNLADAGTGSFREAVSQPHRYVVFAVGGVIHLKSNVAVASDLTIAGHSAPGDGIVLYGKSVSFSGSSNVVVRYVRFREGISGDKGKCSVNNSHGAQMIFDHCSIEWGRWDCLGVTQGSHDLTFQNCIIGEGIDPQRFGSLTDSATNITYARNLWINNQSRNPKAKGLVQYVNNVVCNWGVTGLVGGHSGADHWLDAIGNCFIKGPSSNSKFVGQFAATDHVFQRDNFADLERDGKFNPRPVVEKDFGDGDGAPTFSTNKFLAPAVAVKIMPAEAAFKLDVKSAGASLHRDAVDTRLITELSSLGQLGKISHTEAEVGGQPELKSGSPALDYAKFKTATELDTQLETVLPGS